MSPKDLPHLPDITPDIGEQPGAVQEQGKESVVEIVPLQKVAFLTAGHHIFGDIRASFGQRHDEVFDLGIESPAEKRQAPAAIATECSGVVSVGAERLDLCHYSQLDTDPHEQPLTAPQFRHL